MAAVERGATESEAANEKIDLRKSLIDATYERFALVARYAQLPSWTMIIRKAPRALCDMRMAMYCSDVAPHTATAAPGG